MKPNVLCLSHLWETFIHHQVVEILKTGRVEVFTNFHISYYAYLRNSTVRKKMNSEFSKHIPRHLYNISKFLGLPKNIFFEYYGNFLTKLLIPIFKKNQFNIIHAHTLYPSGYAAYLLSRKFSVPYIVTTHGMDFYRCLPEVSINSRGKQYNKNTLLKIDKVLKNANKVVTVSEKFCNDVANYSPESRVVTIENGYNKEIFKPGSKVDARKRLKIDLDTKLIVSVGYFVKKKGHSYLIKSIKSIKQAFPNIQCYIIGGGQLKKQYLKQIADLKLSNDVFLIENLVQKELVNWYQAADIFIFPSLDEPFGIALIEAMACGLPSIATMTQGPSRIISPSNDGMIIPIKDSKAIEEKVIQLLQNTDKLNEMGQNAAKNIFEKYGTKEEDIIDLYYSIFK